MRGLVLVSVLSFTAVVAASCGGGGGTASPTPTNSPTPTPGVTPTLPPTPPPTPTPSGTPPAAGTYYPLKINDSWTYATTDVVAGNSSKTVHVDSFGDIGGAKAGTNGFQVRSTDATGKYKFDWAEDRGILVIRHREQTFSAASVLKSESIYNPSKLLVDMQASRMVQGAVYYEQYDDTTTDSTVSPAVTTTLTHFVTWTVDAVAESKTTAAGTFMCLKLHRHGQTSSNLSSDKEYWFAPNVGKIEEDTIDNTGAVTATETLTAYTIL